jgi:hypothetical protein
MIKKMSEEEAPMTSLEMIEDQFMFEVHDEAIA